MGSASDKDKMQPAADTLAKFGIEADVRVMSAHRTPAEVAAFASTARDEGYAAFICGAGMAAHLAGAVAAHTTLPVVGVPLSGGALNGVDALYSTVQMPQGIPVATVAIDGARQRRAARRPDARHRRSRPGGEARRRPRGARQGLTATLGSSGPRARPRRAGGCWREPARSSSRGLSPCSWSSSSASAAARFDASARLTGRDGPEVIAGLAGPNPPSTGRGRLGARLGLAPLLLEGLDLPAGADRRGLRALADAGGGDGAACGRAAACRRNGVTQAEVAERPAAVAAEAVSDLEGVVGAALHRSQDVVPPPFDAVLLSARCRGHVSAFRRPSVDIGRR